MLADLPPGAVLRGRCPVQQAGRRHLGRRSRRTGYYYDGTGRVLRQVAYDDATETWETDYAYGGDYTTPAGGTAQTTCINGEDQDSYITQPREPGAPQRR